jgi:glycosyltransferase involved in cell wall biosynthesis
MTPGPITVADGARVPDTMSTARPGSVVVVPEHAEPKSGRVRQWIVRRVFRAALLAYGALVRLLKALGPRTRPVPAEGADILLTGTFYSDNWVRSHLYPLSLAANCRRIVVVATYPVPAMEKVELVQPSRWLTRLTGDVVARLATFSWTAIRRRPDVVAGFHLLLNGLAAGMLARLVGARAMYFCVGGPNETVDGGIHADNRLFDRLEVPDAVVERYLDEIVDSFDLVITMGTGAVRHYRQKGVRAAFRVIAGGIDGRRFHDGAVEDPSVDVVFVGRLAPVKRVDLLLQALDIVRREHPLLKAVIVGDGELREPLARLTRELDLERNVTFAGASRDVEGWLRRSSVFVLTSDSEGLSLSLMEAMRCGLPAVVSHTGDLGDLVEDGVNGYLVPERTPDAFAAAIAGLVGDRSRRARFSAAATTAAARYDVAAVSRLWDDVLAEAQRPDGLRRVDV